MPSATGASLTRVQIRRIFRRHKGAQIELARELGITHAGVHLWLKGRSPSARIAEAAQRKAQELLAQEQEAQSK